MNSVLLLQFYLKVIEKRLEKILLKKDDDINICNSMIINYKLSNIEIVQTLGKINAYYPLKNRIILKKSEKSTLASLICATHEVGHYIDFNENKFFTKIARKTAILIGVNRIFLIPFFIICFCLSKVFFPYLELRLPQVVIYSLVTFFSCIFCKNSNMYSVGT